MATPRNTYPTEPKVQNVSIKSVTQTYRSVSQNLNVEKRSRGVQRWEVTLDYPMLSRDEAMDIYSFIIQQQGTFGTFEYNLPTPINTTRGTQTVNSAEGTPMVTDTRARLGRAIQVNNFNRNATAALRAGDYFKFSNHDKIYMVTTNLSTDANGQGTLHFTPPLMDSVAAGNLQMNSTDVFENGTTIEYDNPTWTMGLLTDEFEVPIDEHVHYSISIQLGEIFNTTTRV